MYKKYGGLHFSITDMAELGNRVTTPVFKKVTHSMFKSIKFKDFPGPIPSNSRTLHATETRIQVNYCEKVKNIRLFYNEN